METRDEKHRSTSKRNGKLWLVIGVIVLIVLLLFWVDIADMFGAGDGAACILLR